MASPRILERLAAQEATLAAGQSLGRGRALRTTPTPKLRPRLRPRLGRRRNRTELRGVSPRRKLAGGLPLPQRPD